MPKIGLMDVDGIRKKRWEEIDLLGDLSMFHPADPALVAFCIEQSLERADVNPEEVSASQIEKGTRALYLEASTDYYVSVPSEVASIMGTMKHSMVNIPRDGFITETRLFFEEDGIKFGSAKCDTYYVPERRLVDLKNIKWYSIKEMLIKGAYVASPGYVLQLNLFRVLMKKPENQAILLEKYKWLKPSFLNKIWKKMKGTADQDVFDVQSMQLTCVPPDMNWQNNQEALKITENPQIIPVGVPFLDDAEVLNRYKSKYFDLATAREKKWAPLCTPEERWQKPSGLPLRCEKFCPVKAACREMSAEHGERHPLDTWEAIQESKKKAKAA